VVAVRKREGKQTQRQAKRAAYGCGCGAQMRRKANAKAGEARRVRLRLRLRLRLRCANAKECNWSNTMRRKQLVDHSARLAGRNAQARAEAQGCRDAGRGGAWAPQSRCCWAGSHCSREPLVGREHTREHHRRGARWEAGRNTRTSGNVAAAGAIFGPGNRAGTRIPR